MDHRSGVVQWVITTVLVTTRTLQESYEPFNTTPELIARHGYPVQRHLVLTEDGYYLTLHRIPYSRIEVDIPENEDGRKPVVFLQHGVLASSLDWVLTGPEMALGFKLSDAGYDVWMGNLRGNDYSSKHVNLTTSQPEYWEYSWHEIGMYDLPAMLDYVLRITGESNLHFVGHSMGATIAVVLLSEKPHYNDKLKVTVLLAPVVKLEHNTSIFRHSAPIWKALQRVTSFSGLHGFPPNPQLIKRQLEPVCEEQYIGKGICANILHMVAGYSKELNQTLLPILFGHYPTQTSIRTLSHFLQGMNTGKFSKYDHGQEENMKVYKRSVPLEYQVSYITAPVAIFWGDSDPFTDREDISWLADQLPNLVGSFLVPSESFSHLSFLWATDVSDVLYDPLIRLLDQHKNH